MSRVLRPPAPRHWPQLAEAWLCDHAALRVGTAKQWHREIQEAVGGQVPRRSFGQALADWVSRGQLIHACRGIYINDCATPKVCPLELVSGVRPLAIVSLHSALAHGQVLPAPDGRVTCVLPTQAAARAGTVLTDLGHLHFHGVHPKLWPLPDDGPAYALHPIPSVRLASPEKALLDWVYLAGLTNGKALPEVPWADLNWSGLDEERLSYLVHRFRLTLLWSRCRAPLPRRQTVLDGARTHQAHQVGAPEKWHRVSSHRGA